jgi:hypothetical protein
MWLQAPQRVARRVGCFAAQEQGWAGELAPGTAAVWLVGCVAAHPTALLPLRFPLPLLHPSFLVVYCNQGSMQLKPKMFV